jgi:TonB family protein
MRFLIGFVSLISWAGAQATRVEPAYTPQARTAGLQGTVSLYVEVGRDGKPSNVEVMQGLGLGLDEAAIDAVRQRDFPAAKPGLPGEIQNALAVDVKFRLDNPGPWSVDSETYTFSLPNREKYGDIERPVPASYVAPDASACSAAGTTALKFVVGTDGAAKEVGPVKGAPVEALVKAVEKWHFTPARGLGKPVEAHATVVFRCTPDGVLPAKPGEPGPPYPPARGISAPILTSKTEPEYSESARRAKLSGTVLLYVQISPEGKATNIHVVKMLGLGLDQKAMEAVKQWQFKPGMNVDRPVTVEATVEVNFRLL